MMLNDDTPVPLSDHGWEVGEVMEAEETVSSLPLPGSVRKGWGGLTCTFGASGLARGLSVTPTLREEVGLLASTMKQTMSAGAAVRGRELSWVRGEEIGRGSMAVVFRALDQRSGQVIAVKEVSINPNSAEDQKLRAALENELAICKELRHPRIVSFLGHDNLDSNLFIYVEYMPGGSLAQVITQFGALEESLIQPYTSNIVEGIEYLHNREPPVLHRDIKAANILVGLDCQVKLADFGCSKRMDVDTSLNYTMKGSIPWMAPEVIMRTGYSRPADMWSLGCVVIEMATAKPPWGKFDNAMLAMRMIGMSDRVPTVPQTLSSACQGFIACCVRRDMNARQTAVQALQHEFLQGGRLEISDF
jgi:serine/threonine protein kinase